MSLLRRVFPRKRITIAGVFLVSLAAIIVLAWIPYTGFLRFLGWVGFIVTGPILVWRLTRTMIRTSIWRLRNRLIVTYVFIGVVPIVLILALVAIGGYIFAGQTAMYLVSSELDRTLDLLRLPGRVLAMNTKPPHDALMNQINPFLRRKFSDFEIVIQDGPSIVHYPPNSVLAPADDSAPEFSGVTVRNGYYYAWCHSRAAAMKVDVVAPLDRELLAELVPRLGQVGFLGDSAQLSKRKGSPSHLDSLPPRANQFDYEVSWFTPIKISEWGTGKKLDSQLMLISTRPSALLDALFGEKFEVAKYLLYVFVGIAILFFLVEIVSFVIGVSLTRTITGAMQNLYDGTRRVAEGDFSHRIKVKGRDQLAVVSESFNSMTSTLERLVAVEKEKERLQSELEIAREVQNQLFPRTSPRMQTLDITGVCRPARMVSGDYYDFLCLQETSLAMAIGDVAGKGISAALLMASIQSIMRTQLSGVSPALAATPNGSPHSAYSTSNMVSQLNKQLYLNTSPEKYATFLFGIYDEQDRTLTYTNAGHLPPILIRRGEPTLLEVTGTVVGAFPMCRYEEQKIVLEPGDLLVSYTDGVTEPENEYGEEFGTDRLVESLLAHQKLSPEEMVNGVLDAVRNWTSAPELPDDMTVVLVRRNA